MRPNLETHSIGQYLALRQRTGFVDDQGRPNPTYSSDEERIAAFRRLGAAIIQQYQEKHESTPC